MRCPFLRDEPVKSCQASPIRKVVARSSSGPQADLCTTADHVKCGVLRSRHEPRAEGQRCPFLSESLVQYCAVAPVPTYVPWTESPDLRCGGDGHRFCELYLAVAGAGGRGPSAARRPEMPSTIADIDGVAMPAWLKYAPTHLWMDVGDEDVLHVGLDAFVTGLARHFDSVVFLTTRGTERPAVTLSVRGVDFTLAWPRPLRITAVNTRLRFDLDRLVADPYGAGWLFRGKPFAPAHRAPAPPVPLLDGEDARQWMRSEVRRASAWVHERVAGRRTSEGTVMADGGSTTADLLDRLDRDDVVRLVAELFARPAEAGGRR